MDKDRWQQVEKILDQVLSLEDKTERKEFLKSKLSGDNKLRNEVTSLLESIEASHGLWEDLLDSNKKLLNEMAGDRNLSHPDSNLALPERIGHYKIKALLGKGGMGNVYLAERIDSDFHQNVALKVLQREVLNDEMSRRFLQERKILSSLNHPNIARLLDGGISDGGRPYFVMEYVDGLPITAYCSQINCSLQKRIDLFRQACKAVQYAHNNFVVHRDLKPANLLVTKDGQVKILDFGIAKLLDQELSDEQLLQTSANNRLLSLSFAAPEQITIEPITAATDVYALGLLLYELLTGSHPFNFKNKSLKEAEQIIRYQNPIKPSLAGDRLAKKVRGDLDAIILKALRKEPVSRYESVQDMLFDIRRYQKNMPVHAKKDSLTYISHKFIKRNKIALSVSLLFVLFASIFAGYHIQQITKERNKAEAEARKARLVTDYMVDIFASADPVQNFNDTLNVYDLLNRGKDRISNIDNQPSLQVELFQALGNSFINIGDYEEAEQLFLEADSLSNIIYPEQSYETAKSAIHLGSLYKTIRDFKLSLNYYRKANDAIHHLPEGNWDMKSITYSGLGSAMLELGKADSAEALFYEALSLKEEHRAARTEILNTKLELAKAYRAQNNYLKAENLNKEILIELDRLESPNITLLPIVLNNLAYLLRLQNRYAEAEPYYKRSLSLYIDIYGEDHPQSLMILNNLASVLNLQGKNEETEELLKRKLTLTEKRYGTHWRTSSAKQALGIFYFKIKDYLQAVEYFKRSNEMFKSTLNQYHTWTGISNLYWFISSRNIEGSKPGAFEETAGYKILDYNRPYFSDFDSILVSQLIEYTTEYSQADLTAETTLLKDLLERKK